MLGAPKSRCKNPGKVPSNAGPRRVPWASESDRCNICNIGQCPKGITSQDPRLYRRLDVEDVAQRVVDVFLTFDTELKKIIAPLGRSTSLPIRHGRRPGHRRFQPARRLKIKYVV